MANGCGRLQDHLERQQCDRRQGRIRVGVTFGVAGPIFAGAADWAKNTGRPVTSWRGGGLEGAFVTVGRTMEEFCWKKSVDVANQIFFASWKRFRNWDAGGRHDVGRSKTNYDGNKSRL
jgi:hypothetical protein